jgi:hypothetical protein
MEYLMRPEMETKTDRPEFYPVSKIFRTAMNGFLLNKSYGNDINTFMHILRIYMVEDMGFYKPVKQYNKSTKALVISSNITGKEYMQTHKEKIIEMMAYSVLDAIKKIEEMKIKPKTLIGWLFTMM